MFDFQKEVIINDANGIVALTNGFRVDGMVYKNEYVKTVYETAAEKGAPATLTIDMAAIKTAANGNKLVQIVLECGLDRDVRSDFACNLWHFRKPFVVNFDVDKLSDMDMVEKAFNHVSVAGEKIFDAKKSGNTVVLTASTNYITFRSYKADTFVCSDATCNNDSMEVPSTIAPEAFVYNENKIGFGTYEYIIHNLRLPTDANWRFTSPAAVEMPINGVLYTQYSFAYEVPRRIGGLSVAGQMNTSTTTHTFYMAPEAAAAFKALVADKIVEVNGTIPYGSEAQTAVEVKTPEDEGSEE